MCYVAAGRLDGYWARSVKVWDMVAGALMITEAGGVIDDLGGKGLDIWHPQFAASSTRQLQKELLSALKGE
jgi:myo-inositol-1(or 4)-monophosphatase